MEASLNVIEIEAVKQAMTETIAKKTRMAKGNVRSIVTQAFGEAVGQPEG